MPDKKQKKIQKDEAKLPLTDLSQSTADYIQPVIKAIAENKIAKKIAQQDSHRLWIDSNEYTPSDVIKGLLELNSFPIMMPISGEVNTVEDISVYWRWLDALELNGIDILKQLSFGFDIKEPVRHEDIKKDDFDRISCIILIGSHRH